MLNTARTIDWRMVRGGVGWMSRRPNGLITVAGAALGLMGGSLVLSALAGTTVARAATPAAGTLIAGESGSGLADAGLDLLGCCEGTVLVVTEDGFGSGVIVSPEGWLLTNQHAVESEVDRAQKHLRCVSKAQVMGGSSGRAR